MKPKFKLWIEDKDEVIFGQGRFMLLKAIDEQGSISKAAKELSMSYRAAWGKIKASEEKLGNKLLIIHKGGSDGGGAELTDFAKDMMSRYSSFRKSVVDSIDKNFEKYLK